MRNLYYDLDCDIYLFWILQVANGNSTTGKANISGAAGFIRFPFGWQIHYVMSFLCFWYLSPYLLSMKVTVRMFGATYLLVMHFNFTFDIHMWYVSMSYFVLESPPKQTQSRFYVVKTFQSSNYTISVPSPPFLFHVNIEYILP